MEVETLKKLHKTIEKCVNELSVKPDLNPNETKALKDGLEVLDMLECRINDCKMNEGMEYSERGYSGHETPFREYRITSYGRPVRMSYNDGYRPARTSYDDRTNYSGDYGVQGWYRSNDYMPANGYSRHSIGDRVIEMLEKKMDETESGYEREELRKFMHLIRQAAD